MSHPKPAPPLILTGRALQERNKKIDQRERQCCACCGIAITEGASRHHRKLKSRRGGDEVSNGLLLCGSGTTGCHGWAHAEPAQARQLGFTVYSHEDPRQVPVAHVLYGLVYLDDDGGVSKTPPPTEPLRTAA